MGDSAGGWLTRQLGKVVECLDRSVLPAFPLQVCPFMTARRSVQLQLTHCHVSTQSWDGDMRGEAVGENGLPSHTPFLEARKTSLSGDALFVSHQPELDPMTGTCCKGGWEGDSLVFPGSAVGGR